MASIEAWRAASSAGAAPGSDILSTTCAAATAAASREAVGDPAIVPRYGSREDNLDIWLQHVAGGDPIRLTRAADEERQPSFSADGGQILFRSEAGAGGLYTVPTLGGVPRLVVEGGIGGRYSPDGRSIAYWTGGQIGFSNQPGAYRAFVMPATGGEPRQLVGFTARGFPSGRLTHAVC